MSEQQKPTMETLAFFSEKGRVSKHEISKAGGLPALRLALAMQKILKSPKPENSKRENLNKYSRGIKIDEEILSGIEEFTEKRGVPSWVRSAVCCAADCLVPPDRLIAEAEVIAKRRRTMPSRNVAIPIGSTLLKTIEILAKRARLSDKEVIEGCVGLYYKAHIAAIEEQGAEAADSSTETQ